MIGEKEQFDLHRLLPDDGDGDFMSPSPNSTAPPSSPPASSFGTEPPDVDAGEPDDHAANGFGWFLATVTFAIVGALVAYQSLGWWRRRREQRLMDIRSAQADVVLGDMQMVPNEDLDNELI